MDVVRDPSSKSLRLEIFQFRGAYGRHHEIRTFGVRAHPEEKRTIPGNQGMRNEPLGVGDRFVPNVLRVERNRQGEIANPESSDYDDAAKGEPISVPDLGTSAEFLRQQLRHQLGTQLFLWQ